ncbi:C40 family peptidase [Streptomyces flavidovirens]|uniref:C40 family peptidase n=1 Tax=Streptomyces flavidovirens TaxID=67298 RepID=UPI0003F95901|nr:C40 family peptidase [Streptomyces flavidovirens]
MSGRLAKSVCTVALAAATVLTPLPAPATAAAPGAPTPLPPSPPSPAPAPPVVLRAPGKATVAELLTELQRLYQRAEEASETYKATEESVKKQLGEVKRVTAGLSRARIALAESRGAAGRLAREQYQGLSGLSPYLRLLLARDPQHALTQGHVLQRAADVRAATIARLERGERRADELATRERSALDKQQTLARKQKRQRDAVRARLGEVEALLASLTEEQLTGLARLEERRTGAAQRDLLASGALGSPGSAAVRAPSRLGDRALEYAVRQIGKPYVWGAEGPGSFDCSGLTSQAWAHAERAIPRTSQEQWRQLPKVALPDLRPGDLVIYFPKATHVAIYLGKGLVVQAPRPGSRVKVSPIAANPLLGAVRPDPQLNPLPSYTPPKLPRGASAGADRGYGEESAPGV